MAGSTRAGDGSVANQASSGTISRAVAVLRTIAESNGEVSVAGVANELGLPRPTVHRLLNLLREEGMVESREATRTYGIGQEFFRVAALVLKRQDLSRLARPVMEQVVDGCGETCLLGAYLPAQRRMMFVTEVASAHPLGYRVEFLTPISVAWGASGRAILAFLRDEDIEAVLRDEGPSPVTGKPLSSRATMLAELERIRADGYAYTVGQKLLGSRGVAAPIFGPDGYALGSLCLTIPEMRFDEGAEAGLGRMLAAHSASVSALLGYEPTAASS